MINSSHPDFRIAQSTPATMPLPHGMSYGASKAISKGTTAMLNTMPESNMSALRKSGAPVSKQNSDMAAHLDQIYSKSGPKSFGQGFGGH